MFAKAVELDPSFARAYAGIANRDRGLPAGSVWQIPDDVILATAGKALALAPELAEAHAARARL